MHDIYITGYVMNYQTRSIHAKEASLLVLFLVILFWSYCPKLIIFQTHLPAIQWCWLCAIQWPLPGGQYMTDSHQLVMGTGLLL